jgi:hypothetical protein
MLVHEKNATTISTYIKHVLYEVLRDTEGNTPITRDFKLLVAVQVGSRSQNKRG